MTRLGFEVLSKNLLKDEKSLRGGIFRLWKLKGPSDPEDFVWGGGERSSPFRSQRLKAGNLGQGFGHVFLERGGVLIRGEWHDRLSKRESKFPSSRERGGKKLEETRTRISEWD